MENDPATSIVSQHNETWDETVSNTNAWFEIRTQTSRDFYITFQGLFYRHWSGLKVWLVSHL